jgi:hypothetical protein
MSTEHQALPLPAGWQRTHQGLEGLLLPPNQLGPEAAGLLKGVQELASRLDSLHVDLQAKGRR